MKNINISTVKVLFFRRFTKYFIGCLYDDYKYKPLHKIFPKMSAFVKSFDSQIK